MESDLNPVNNCLHGTFYLYALPLLVRGTLGFKVIFIYASYQIASDLIHDRSCFLNAYLSQAPPKCLTHSVLAFLRLHTLSHGHVKSLILYVKHQYRQYKYNLPNSLVAFCHVLLHSSSYTIDKGQRKF